MKRINKSGLSQAIILALASQGAFAQDKDLDGITVTGTELEQVGPYYSGLKMDATWLDIPQSISIISAEDIELRGAIKLEDVLKGVPGVNMALGEGARDHFSIRGYDALNDFYRNGLRDGGNVQAYRSLQNVERIEVVKGVAGALYGRGSAGGLINLVSKKADGHAVANFSVSTGSFSQQRVSADLGDKLTENVNGRINIEYKEADSFVDNVEGETLFIAPTLRIDLSNKTTVDLDLEYLKQEQTPYRGVPSENGRPLDVSRSTNYGGKSDYQDSESIRATMNINHKFNENLSWRNNVSYSKVEMEQSGTRNSVVTGDVLSRKIVAFAFDPQTEKGLQSELTWMSDRHQILLGTEVSRMERTSTSGSGLPGIPDSNLYDPEEVSYTSPSFVFNRVNTVDSYAFYAQDLINLTDKLTLLAGARYDKVESEQETVSTSFTHKDSAVSPRLGLVYALADDLSVYASWGRSYQLPWGGIYARDSKPNLLESEQSEIGIKSELLDKRLSVSAALFSLDREDTETDDAQNVIATNRDRHQGLELEAKGDLTDNWSLSAGYTYLHARNRDSDKRPNDVPKQTVSIWSTVIPAAGWTVGAGAYYVGERYAGNNERVKQDGYTTVDMMAAYQSGPHKVQLNLNNVFDEKYSLAATGKGSGLHQIGYGAPFSAMVTYSLEY